MPLAIRRDDSRQKKLQQADKNNPMMNELLAVGQFAEILVPRYQNRIRAIGDPKNLAIRNSWIQFNDIQNGVPFDAQVFNDLAINTLVCNEVHTVASSIG
jgi:hypothetical protein